MSSKITDKIEIELDTGQYFSLTHGEARELFALLESYLYSTVLPITKKENTAPKPYHWAEEKETTWDTYSRLTNKQLAAMKEMLRPYLHKGDYPGDIPDGPRTSFFRQYKRWPTTDELWLFNTCEDLKQCDSSSSQSGLGESTPICGGRL